MALRINTNQEDRTVVGNKRYLSGTLTLITSYATNGETITAKDLGFDAVSSLSVFGDGSNVPVYDSASQKIVIYTSDGTEMSAVNVAVGEQLTFRFDSIGW